MVDRKKGNLLKYNVTGDCLAIKLEGDLLSWRKYFEQIQFWSEIEFPPPSFPLPLYNAKQESLVSKQYRTMDEGAERYIFMVKDRKLPFGGLFKYILSKFDKTFWTNSILE